MIPLPDLSCACATIRRAARLVTQLYSQEMGGEIEPAQFSLLTALHTQPRLNQSRLATALGLDKTTMSRNLRVVQSYGWIKTATTKDLRESGYILTALGKKTLAAAQPAWSRAQTRLRSNLKPGEWEKMMEVLGRLSTASLAAQDPRE
jgi:DNA-binding MarR family transcriptional regulator